MFIKNEKIRNQWVKFTDIIGNNVDETLTYFIQNNGGNTIICLDSATPPNVKDNEGIVLFPNTIAEYKKGEGELYLKAIGYENSNSTISISNNQ